MERINNKEKKVILKEHQNRYLWSNQFARGSVLDIACGTGYSSNIFSKNKNITKYIGIDPDKESIEIAKKNIVTNWNIPISYLISAIEDIPLETNSLDTIISLETLEHVKDLNKAIRETKRVIKTNGLFVGSVPTATMEDYATKLYGLNIFHINTFTFEDLYSLLHMEYKNVYIGISKVVIGSETQFEYANLSNINIERVNSINSYFSKNNSSLGSFVFIATNSDEIIHLPNQQYYFGLDFIEHDKEELENIIKPLQKRLDVLDDYIKNLEKKVLDLTSHIASRDKEVLSRDEYIKALEKKLLENTS
jgi:ubiquinone/menaquinone biosynthesis C-methylase UbiE